MAKLNVCHLFEYSGVSMCNFNEEEEEDDAPTKEKVEENEQMKEKMKQIRLKMDKLNISKKVWYYMVIVIVPKSSEK